MTADETKQKILKTAEKLFYEKGYNAVTATELIRESGTNKGSFYFHFIDKQHLAMRLNEQLHNEIRDQITKEFPENDEFEQFFLFFEIIWRISFQNENYVRFDRDFFGEQNNNTYYDNYTNLLYALSPKKYSYSEMVLLEGATKALTEQFIAYCSNNINKLKEKELVYFLYRTIFNIYDVPKETIDHYLSKSYEHLEQLEIESSYFHITIRRKENV